MQTKQQTNNLIVKHKKLSPPSNAGGVSMGCNEHLCKNRIKSIGGGPLQLYQPTNKQKLNLNGLPLRRKNRRKKQKRFNQNNQVDVYKPKFGNQTPGNINSQSMRRRIIGQQFGVIQNPVVGAFEWAQTILDPFGLYGVRQPSLFPQPTTTCRAHSLLTVTANSSGYAWILLQPSTVTGMIQTNTAATTTQTVFGTWTAGQNIPSYISTHPLYKANWRLVSAGLKAWLTTPFINSTGQFLGATCAQGNFNNADSTTYDMMGDLPTRIIASAEKTIQLVITPMDLSSQLFNAYDAADLTANAAMICFTGNANAQISVEYNANYEMIPLNNVDAFNMVKGSTSDPQTMSGIINSIQPNPTVVANKLQQVKDPNAVKNYLKSLLYGSVKSMAKEGFEKLGQSLTGIKLSTGNPKFDDLGSIFGY